MCAGREEGAKGARQAGCAGRRRVDRRREEGSSSGGVVPSGEVVPESFLTAGEMGFDGAERLAEDGRDFVVRETRLSRRSNF